MIFSHQTFIITESSHRDVGMAGVLYQTGDARQLQLPVRTSVFWPMSAFFKYSRIVNIDMVYELGLMIMILIQDQLCYVCHVMFRCTSLS